MSTANLAPDVTDEQVSARSHPMDDGLSTDEWADRDPKGFDAAARDAVDPDDLWAMVKEMLAHPDQPFRCPVKWRERIEKALAAEADRGASWVRDWQNRFYEEE